MTDFPITNLSTFFDIVSLSFMAFPVMGKKVHQKGIKGWRQIYRVTTT
jgi:hypothetical protein